MSVQFAATYPERTRALVLYGADAPHAVGAGLSRGARTEARRRTAEAQFLRTWGSDASESIAIFAPSMVEGPRICARGSRAMCRASASPGAAVALRRMNRSIDVRPLLGS